VKFVGHTPRYVLALLEVWGSAGDVGFKPQIIDIPRQYRVSSEIGCPNARMKQNCALVFKRRIEHENARRTAEVGTR
jgi:hypothetical protein